MGGCCPAGRRTRAQRARCGCVSVCVVHKLCIGVHSFLPQCVISPAGLVSCCSIQDGPLVLAGSWLSSLVQLRTLGMQVPSIELGSDCGQLAALRDVHMSCGWEAPCDDAQLW